LQWLAGSVSLGQLCRHIGVGERLKQGWRDPPSSKDHREQAFSVIGITLKRKNGVKNPSSNRLPLLVLGRR